MPRSTLTPAPSLGWVGAFLAYLGVVPLLIFLGRLLIYQSNRYKDVDYVYSVLLIGPIVAGAVIIGCVIISSQTRTFTTCLAGLGTGSLITLLLMLVQG